MASGLTVLYFFYFLFWDGDNVYSMTCMIHLKNTVAVYDTEYFNSKGQPLQLK